MTPGECRSVRLTLGLTADDLARRAGISRSTLLRFEGGRDVRPRAISAVRMALEADHSPKALECAPLAMDPRFPAEAQFDVHIADVGLRNFAGNGNVLRCVDISVSGIRPSHGDYVIAERWQNQARAIFAKRLLEQNGDYELWSDSDGSLHREPVIKLTKGLLQNDEVRVIAKIICCYKKHEAAECGDQIMI
jgi:transcriptional regulator with XRE-family HTH domain